MQSANIRALNDAMRFRIPMVGENDRLMLTAGVACLSVHSLTALLDAVRSFADFDADNDPHEEHDFGRVILNGENFFFKFQYFDRSLEAASPDPADQNATVRVLTLMLAHEY